MTRDELFLDAARGYVGCPWKHQGRSRLGLDCIGLVVLALRDCGLDAPMTAVYGRMADYFKLKPVLCEYATRIGDIRPGALLLYKRGLILHMAIAAKAGEAVQALNTVGRVIESPLNFKVTQSWGIKWPS